MSKGVRKLYSRGKMYPSGFEGAARSEAVRVWLLGRFRVSVGSRIITQDAWRLRKAAALVKLLALAPGHHMHREQAMDLLWPDSGRKAASNSLRTALHATRKIFDPATGANYLASEDESLVLCPGGVLWVDVEAFEAAATARRAKEPATYRAALDLYWGELLPEDRYETWTEGRRNELRQLYLALLLELAGLHEERHEHELAIEVLRKATAEEPTFEEAHVALMRLHALSGRPEQALAQYERLRDILSRGLGTQPGASSRRLRHEIAAGRLIPTSPSSPVQDEPSDVTRHNLPAPMTSFVGREREMLEVKRTLAMTNLLTLTGAGGSGKTRLAVEVARNLVGVYPDGVWLVELAGLSEGDLVTQAVAGALQVPERPGQTLTDTLVEALADKELLLVVDNCEHLVEAAALLVDALRSSSLRLRVLATSRAPLGVIGELTWLVPSLSMPGAEETPTVEEVEGYESARLFTDRASKRHPGFQLTSENAQAVAHVCVRLEGIPLAIELAAARVGMLSAEQISERLGQSLDLLTRGERTADQRHQTLMATLDWSYELLDEPEQALFGRLSVFAGGFTLEAAESVGAGGDIREGNVLELLTMLVEKSLVVAEESWERGARYRLLEPVRQYAREKLGGSGEDEAVGRRHAEFFLALVEDAELGLRTPTAGLLESLETEHDNLRGVLAWAVDREEAELGQRLAGALRWFWFSRGYFSEGRRWLEELLQQGGQTAARVKALLAMCMLAHQQDDLDELESAAEEALKLSTEIEVEDNLLPEIRGVMATAVGKRGDVERATELLEEGVALGREVGDRWGVALNLQTLGSVWGVRGDYERATELLEESLALLQELGDVAHSAIVLNGLGEIAVQQGDYERATALCEEAAVLFRQQGHVNGIEAALRNLGRAALLHGDYEKAKASYEESLALCREQGNKWTAIDDLEGLACSAAARGALNRAAKLFGAVEALYIAMSHDESPANRALRAPYEEAARSQLDETVWEAAFADGKIMGLEEAVEYALSEEGPATPTLQALDPSTDRAQRPTLTHREEEIAALVARGLTNRQIAAELVISERTVDHHVGSILKKLNLHSRKQVATAMTEH